MPVGAGKYDVPCTKVFEETKADAAVLIILNGEHGSGFSVTGDALVSSPLDLVYLLRQVADEIERSVVNIDA